MLLSQIVFFVSFYSPNYSYFLPFLPLQYLSTILILPNQAISNIFLFLHLQANYRLSCFILILPAIFVFSPFIFLQQLRLIILPPLPIPAMFEFFASLVQCFSQYLPLSFHFQSFFFKQYLNTSSLYSQYCLFFSLPIPAIFVSPQHPFSQYLSFFHQLQLFPLSNICLFPSFPSIRRLNTFVSFQSFVSKQYSFCLIFQKFVTNISLFPSQYIVYVSLDSQSFLSQYLPLSINFTMFVTFESSCPHFQSFFSSKQYLPLSIIFRNSLPIFVSFHHFFQQCLLRRLNTSCLLPIICRSKQYFFHHFTEISSYQQYLSPNPFFLPAIFASFHHFSEISLSNICLFPSFFRNSLRRLNTSCLLPILFCNICLFPSFSDTVVEYLPRLPNTFPYLPLRVQCLSPYKFLPF
ncbi:unnamed protein product [Acanthosepion pharaonis]|uniref:Uncharacterized protein n=1 Tax=Acanthosepion pharaonis TaxID=158019 RepID=A0A812CQ67_ACAPH|nr:unnamed protein product [Sepia pharaonis]